MARLIILALVLLCLTVIAGLFIVSALRQGRQEKDTVKRDKDAAVLRDAIHDLAFDHLDVSPELAREVLERFDNAVKYPLGNPVEDIPTDVLRLCIEHRETDPNFSTILADTIRLHGHRMGPREIG